MRLYALNETDSKLSGGIDWRQKLESQRGAVLATELKNNSNKLAKWTVQACPHCRSLLARPMRWHVSVWIVRRSARLARH